MKKVIHIHAIFLFVVFLSTGLFAQSGKPQVENSKITIPINTKLIISVENNNGTLNNFKLLEKEKVNKPIDMMSSFEDIEKEEVVSNEIELSFSYADWLDSKMIVLTTVQHLEQTIHFKAKIKLKDSNRYFETSIVDVYPNVISMEQWQDDIESIILYDFVIVED